VGGTDGTVEVCDEYASKDSRIASIHDNKGLVQARNVGYNNAKGQWITYVDGDDWVSSDFVEKITTGIENHKEIDMMFFCASLEKDDKTVDGKWNWNQYTSGKVYDKEECQRLSSYSMNYRSGLSDAWAKAFRLDWCKKHNLFHNPQLRQGEESVDFVMRAFYYAQRALFLDSRLYHYRYNINSISKRVDEKNAYCIVDCINVMSDFISSIPNNSIFVKEFEMRNVYVIISIAMQTYFNPKNNLAYKERVLKFSKLISDNALLKRAIQNVQCRNFDKFRMVAFWCIKNKLFRLLDIIGWLKWVTLRFDFLKY
jgi:glycosyltransferase involved in cell wall biosynthesis